MTLIPAAAHAFVEFTLNGVEGKGWSWDFHNQSDENATIGDLAAIGDEIQTLLNGTLKTYLGNTCVFTRILLRGWHTLTPPVLDYVTGLPITCSGSAAVSPGNVNLCLKKSSNYGGRSKRGRIYVPAIPEGSIDSTNTVADAFVTNVLAAFNQFKDDIVTNIGWEWGIAHTVSGGSPLTEGDITPIAEIIAVDKTVDTQRRRLR